MSRSHEKEGKTIRTVKDTLEHAILYLRTVVKWCAAAALIGLVGGAVGALFHLGVEYATMLREEVPALLWALPLAAALALGCAWVSILFCEALRRTEHFAARRMRNPYLRAVLGGCLVIALTYLVGCRDYNGVGTEVIAAALGGTAKPEAFLLKIVFTAVTLGVTGLFCGMTNCPITSLLISVELFGADGLLCYAVVCAVSYVFSGYRGLYSSQTILYSKLRAEFINVHTK